MIYLIDDKKARQNDFGWTEEKFTKLASYLRPLYTIEDVMQFAENLYDDKNIILYHESFLDFTANRARAVDQRKKLVEMSASIDGLAVAFFSGSQSSRSLNKNNAYLPVGKLYENLEFFVEQYKLGNGNLKYLLFGENPENEEELNEILIKRIKEMEVNAAVISGKTLFIRPTSMYIQNAILDATEGTVFNDVSDEKLSDKINEWLNDAKFDNIFLPLCFGNVLSDFNGLRLATHIRCTKSINQLSRIFIYGFIGLDYLITDEYFNILKTKNVILIPFSKDAFSEFGNKNENPLTQEELTTELAKLKLDVPGNYFDSHHIANEWGIYQMARNAGIDISEVEGFDKNKFNKLYFKWLIAKNRLEESIPDVQKKEQIEYAERLPGLKVLGKIDVTKFHKR